MFKKQIKIKVRINNAKTLKQKFGYFGLII